MMSQGSEITVVVMERGAQWPGCIESCRRVTPDMVVIAQDAGESPEALARRVEARIVALHRENRPVRGAVIAVSRRSDEVSLECRSRLARSLLRALNATETTGSFWLCAPPAAAEGVRHHLIALAGTLTSMLGNSTVGVSVRFPERGDAARHDSATHAIGTVVAPMSNAS
jgi:hypothetical protein